MLRRNFVLFGNSFLKVTLLNFLYVITNAILFTGCGAFILSGSLTSSSSPPSSSGTQSAASAPGGPSAFSFSFDFSFSNQSAFTFDPSRIDFSTNVCRLTPNLTSDNSNNSQTGFGAATLSNTTWDPVGGFVRLSSGQSSGTVTSRVMDALNSTTWTSLSWAPTLPFYKELPDGANSETTSSYSSLSNSSLMVGNVALWHMNENSWIGASGEIKDTSGSGYHGQAIAGASTAGVGRFGRAGAFNGTTFAFFPSQTGLVNVLNSGADFSVSLWANPGSRSGGVTDQILHLGGITAGNCGGAFGLSINRNGGDVGGSGVDSFTGRIGMCNIGGTNASTPDNSVVAGTWYHVVITYNGFSNTTSPQLMIYLNGQLPSGTNGYGVTSITPWNVSGQTPTPAHLASGDLELGAYAFTDTNHNNPALYQSGYFGLLDEVGIWNRVLSAAEITQLYRRGANRLQFQVRSCAQAGCASVPPWVGPDGTSSTFFSELYNTTSYILGSTVQSSLPLFMFSSLGSLALSPNRYFQYQATLNSDDQNSLCSYNSSSANCSPELKSVSLSGPKSYDFTGPTVSNLTGVSFKSLTGFSATLSGSCPGGVQFQESPDATHWYYWSGSAWAAASSSSQSNTSSVVNTNISSLANVSLFNTSSQLFVKAFLNSDGTQPCALSNVTVSGMK